MSSWWIREKLSTSFRNLFWLQESSGFSFSKHFADDLSKGELICLLAWSRIRKLWGKTSSWKRTSALNFVSVQISNFKHSTGLNVIYHDQRYIGNRHQPKIWEFFSFNVTFCPELASPWGGHYSNSLKVDRLTRHQGFSGLSFPFNKC